MKRIGGWLSAALGAGLALLACPPALAQEPPLLPHVRLPEAGGNAPLAAQQLPTAPETAPTPVRAPSSAAGASLTLEEAIGRALRANRGLADARDDTRKAKFNIDIQKAEFELRVYPGVSMGLSRSSGSDPAGKLGLGVSLDRKYAAYGTEVSVYPAIKRSGGTYTSGADLTITQPLLRGLDHEYQMQFIRGAEYYERSSRRAHYLKQVETVMGVARLVYEAVRQREMLRLSSESVERLRGHARAAELKASSGVISHIDLYRARIQLKSVEDNFNQAREGYRDALDSLKVFLALPMQQELEVSAPLSFDRVEIAEEKAVKTAVDLRVELDQAQDTVQEARRQTRVAKEDTWPELNLVLSHGWWGSAEEVSKSALKGESTWSLGLASNSDLRRTTQKAVYEQRLIDQQVAGRRGALARDEVVQQVKRELNNLRRLEQAIANQEEQIEQSKSQMELAKVKFDHGLASNFDLIEAESNLRSSQSSLITAVVNYILGQYNLRAVLGTLVERPRSF